MQFQRWLAPPDLSWTTQWLLSTQAGVWNWQWFESKEFDDLHFAALRETDNDKRAKMLMQLPIGAVSRLNVSTSPASGSTASTQR